MQTFVLIAQATKVLSANQPEQTAQMQDAASGSSFLLGALLVLSMCFSAYLLYQRIKAVKATALSADVPEELSIESAVTTRTSVHVAHNTATNISTPDEQTLELERLRKENNDMNNQMTTLSEENERMKTTVQDLAGENKSLAQDRDSIHNLLLAAEQTKQKMVEEIGLLKKQTASLEEKNTHLEEDCNLMKASQNEIDKMYQHTTDLLEAFCGGKACLAAFEWQIPEQIPERLSVLALARFLLCIKLENADRALVFRELDDTLIRLLSENPDSLTFIREKIRKTVNESMSPDFEIEWPVQESNASAVSSAVIRDLRSIV